MACKSASQITDVQPGEMRGGQVRYNCVISELDCHHFQMAVFSPIASPLYTLEPTSSCLCTFALTPLSLQGYLVFAFGNPRHSYKTISKMPLSVVPFLSLPNQNDLLLEIPQHLLSLISNSNNNENYLLGAQHIDK